MTASRTNSVCSQLYKFKLQSILSPLSYIWCIYILYIWLCQQEVADLSKMQSIHIKCQRDSIWKKYPILSMLMYIFRQLQLLNLNMFPMLSSNSRCWSILGIPIILIVGYCGGTGNRPRWIGIGMGITCFGSLVYALPHFMTRVSIQAQCLIGILDLYVLDFPFK